MKTQEPMLIVFAGPNGSGKSSVTNVLYERNSDLPSLFINADDMARAIVEERKLDVSILKSFMIDNRANYN